MERQVLRAAEQNSSTVSFYFADGHFRELDVTEYGGQRARLPLARRSCHPYSKWVSLAAISWEDVGGFVAAAAAVVVPVAVSVVTQKLDWSDIRWE